MHKKKSIDNSEFRKNLCNYIEQYEKESTENLKNSKETKIDEKRNSLMDKYLENKNKVIEEEYEEDNEFNEFTKRRKLSTNYSKKDMRRNDDEDNIV